MNIKLLSLTGVVLLAFVLRWLLPSDNGFTVYLRQRTTFIPLNLVAFWATVGLALVVGAVVLLVRYRRS